MIEGIVISEYISLSARIIRWININKFYLAAELLFHGVEGNEVVALDDEVLSDNSVLITTKGRFPPRLSYV